MEGFVKQLQELLYLKLDEINANKSPVKGYDEKTDLVEWAITQIKHHLLMHPFQDNATEVSYFKYWAPSLYKLQIFFATVFDLELCRITSDKETFFAHLQNEKDRIVAFFRENQVLHRYYYSGKTSKDETLFVHKSLSGTPQFPTDDPSYCQASLILSELLAYEDYRIILDKEIGSLTASIEDLNTVGLKWAGTKSEAVELLMLFYEVKLFDDCDGQSATIDKLIIWAKEELNVDLKDWSVIDNNNRMRKKSANALLDKFIQAARNRGNRLNP